MDKDWVKRAINRRGKKGGDRRGKGAQEILRTYGSWYEHLGWREREEVRKRDENGRICYVFSPPAREGKADERIAGKKDKASGGKEEEIAAPELFRLLLTHLEASFGCYLCPLQCKNEEHRKKNRCVHAQRISEFLTAPCGLKYGDNFHFQHGTIKLF